MNCEHFNITFHRRKGEAPQGQRQRGNNHRANNYGGAVDDEAQRRNQARAHDQGEEIEVNAFSAV